jgi:hypothetical protein
MFSRNIIGKKMMQVTTTTYRKGDISSNSATNIYQSARPSTDETTNTPLHAPAVCRLKPAETQAHYLQYRAPSRIEWRISLIAAIKKQLKALQMNTNL